MSDVLQFRCLTDMSSQLKTVDKKFAAAIRKELRASVLAAGAGVLADVKSRASWSTVIPGATGISIRYNPKGASIRIQVNHSKARHARPLEMGNRRSFSEAEIAKRTTTIAGIQVGRRKAMAAMRREGVGVSNALRHPVFNRGGWTTEPTRPFFFPAINAQKVATDRLFWEAVVIKSVRDSGFK